MSEPQDSLPLGGPKRPQGAPAAQQGQQPKQGQQVKQARPGEKDEPDQPMAADGRVWYRVVQGGQFSVGKGMTKLPTGEVINSPTYNVDQIRASGIKVEPCEAPEWFTRAQGAG